MIMAAKTKQGEGRKLSPETRAKISAAKTGKKRGPLSAEHRANIAAAMKVRKLGAEHRRNISAALKGRKSGPLSAEHRANIAAANKGRKKSPEHVAKIAAANRGRLVSAETRDKMSAVRKGRKHSAEHRANIAAAMKDVDTRAAISAAKKGGRFIPAHLVDQVEAILDRRPPDRATADSRPEPTTSPRPSLPTIRLGLPGEPFYLCGQQQGSLEAPDHDVIRALLEAGPEKGLSGKELEDKSGAGAGGAS